MWSQRSNSVPRRRRRLLGCGWFFLFPVFYGAIMAINYQGNVSMENLARGFWLAALCMLSFYGVIYLIDRQRERGP